MDQPTKPRLQQKAGAAAAASGKRRASQITKKKGSKNIEKQPQKKRQLNDQSAALSKRQLAIKEAGEEEIDSDEIDTNSVASQEEGRTNAERLAEFDEENEDRKRVRLAQQILKSTAKKQQKSKALTTTTTAPNELVDSDSFDDGEDSGSEADSFKGVIHAEAKHSDAITRALQNDILKKRQLVFTHFADKVLKSLQKSSTLTTLKGHTRCITSLQFCPVTSHLFSASKDASIIKWDLTTPASTTESSQPNATQKTFLIREKTPDAHKDEILSMSVNHLGKYMVTGSKDKSIKLWDLKKMSIVQTFAGHKQPVNGVKFGINSNTFCSVSLDRQFKMWDATDKAFIDTFFGHKAEVNSIDAVSGENFISCGFDRQVIVWKTEHQSQLIYAGHDYSIDVVKAVDSEHFITASQDGSIALWSVKKKKPVFVEKKPHGDNWVTALGNLYNTDVFFSGSSDNKINVYKIDLVKKTFAKIFEIPCSGIINDIQLSVDCSMLAFSECDEHRLGRWIVSPKSKNVIKYLKFA